MPIGSMMKGKLIKDMKKKMDAKKSRSASSTMPADTVTPVMNNTPRFLAAMKNDQDNGVIPRMTRMARMARKRRIPQANIAPTVPMEKGGSVKPTTAKKNTLKMKPKTKR